LQNAALSRSRRRTSAIDPGAQEIARLLEARIRYRTLPATRGGRLKSIAISEDNHGRESLETALRS
jgi:hypothetical protein